MRILDSLIIALAMYSRIPMPLIPWTKERMAYVMAWFPLAGLLEGILWNLWLVLAERLGFSQVLTVLGACALPILFTGGIHMDGFLDTVDALRSYGTREKKLEILKDPHTGAFAVIGAVVYLMLYVAFAWEGYRKGNLPWMAMVFVIERALSGWSVTVFPTAKKQGLAASFSQGASKEATCICLGIWLVLGCGALWLSAGAPKALVLFAGTALVFAAYRRLCMKEFGGVTGDLAGYFLQTEELAALVLFAVIPW